jgi:hypothetical protein
MSVTTLWLAWQDPKERRWLPVGRLRRDAGVYRFAYTQGALESRAFVPFPGLEDLRRVHQSLDLPPFFARLLPPLRRGAESRQDPLEALALFGGRAGSDQVEVFAEPTRQDGAFRLRFFVRGIRHVDAAARDRISRLRPGERLFLMADVQNEHDALALALRTADPAVLLGYCPTHVARDFRVVLENSAAKTQVVVEQVDLQAPVQTMLLCEMSGPWPSHLRPCSEEMYQTIADDVATPV